jgi:hypothetical protein
VLNWPISCFPTLTLFPLWEVAASQIGVRVGSELGHKSVSKKKHPNEHVGICHILTKLRLYHSGPSLRLPDTKTRHTSSGMHTVHRQVKG